MAEKHPMVKALLSLSICAIIATLCACGDHLVRAQPPIFTPPHQEAACPQGCIAMQSNPTFLELRFGPTTNTDQDGFTTVIPFPMKVSMLDVWIGTQSGAMFESDSRLQVVLPDGTFYEFKAQYDKHQDVVGSLQRSFPVNLTLPAGTMLTVYHSAQGIVSCPSGCGYDTTWSLSSF